MREKESQEHPENYPEGKRGAGRNVNRLRGRERGSDANLLQEVLL